MSPGPRAEAFVVAVDAAEVRAAAAGRRIADSAEDLDAVGRRLAGAGAGGGEGARARSGVGAGAGAGAGARATAGGVPASGPGAGGGDPAGGWSGRAGTTARSRVADAAAAARVFSGACLFLADVLRVEGSRLSRAVVAWSDDEQLQAGSGDVIAIRDADNGLVARLREAADCLAGYTDAATVACIDLSGSTDDDPRRVAQLWHSLDPAERDRLARDHPTLGSIAGVSSATRDALNRTRLRRMLEAVGADADADAGGGANGAANGAGGAKAATGLAALAAHLAEDPGRHLLALHADGRAVVASADPDGAQRVVTLIPGTGSSLDDLGRTAERAGAVCEAAGDGTAAGRAPTVGGGATTDAAGAECVSVSWQGYDAPPDVAAAGFSTDRATEHAADLRTHAAGLDAVEAMDGDDASHTAVGYSYGSTVLGAAAADSSGLAADRMIHVGSPGATVESLADQWVDDGGVARAATDGDVVGVVSRWDPVPWWSITGVLGGRPGTEDFGGLAVDVTEPGSGPASVRGAHSTYFDAGTVSLEEIGRLIADPDGR